MIVFFINYFKIIIELDSSNEPASNGASEKLEKCL